MRNNKLKKVLLIIIVAWISYYSYKNYLRPVEGNKLVNNKSEHYINSLYQSDAHNYNYLNPNEKKLYKDFVDISLHFYKNIDYNFANYGCKEIFNCNVSITKVFEAISLDHPELIQLSSYSYKYKENNPLIELKMDYAISNKLVYNLAVRKMERKIDDIKKATKNMTDKEKILFVYDWIGQNTRYDFVFTYNSKNQSAYNSLIRSKGVCASFAKSSQLIFQNIGIESMIVHGFSTGPHMWNIVKLDGRYYIFDSTVSSGRKKDNPYYYEGLNQTFLSSYSITNPERYPKTEKNNFYK